MSSASTTESAPELPILKATSEFAYFEKSTLFPGRGTIALSDAMSRHPAAQMFRPIRITTCVRNFQLTDVVLDADTPLLFKDRAKVTETSYFVDEHAEKAAFARTGRPIWLDDDCSYALVPITRFMASTSIGSRNVFPPSTGRCADEARRMCA